MKCRNCLITDNIPGVAINSDRICNYCTGEKCYEILENPQMRRLFYRKEELRNEFENLINSTKGAKDFDCLLALSGGKDSAYLLYYLHKHSNLRILAVTIDTGFESHVALENIKHILTKTPVDHLMIDCYIEPFKKIYRHFLSSAPSATLRYLGIQEGRHYVEVADSSKESSVAKICGTCTLLWQSILLRAAKEREIPLLFIAYSPDQIGHYFYRIPRDQIAERNWYPEYLTKDLLTRAEKKIFWNEDDTRNTKVLPEVIFPFHVFEDYSVELVTETLHKQGMLHKRRSSQFVTNCRINWLMMYRDLNRLGYNPYLESYSYLIRKRKLIKTRRWQLQFAIGNFLIKRALFPRKIMKQTLDELGLTFGDLRKA